MLHRTVRGRWTLMRPSAAALDLTLRPRKQAKALGAQPKWRLVVGAPR